jgi:F-box domain.
MDNISLLPCEILFEILKFLSFGDFTRLVKVSKYFNELIKSRFVLEFLCNKYTNIDIDKFLEFSKAIKERYLDCQV